MKHVTRVFALLMAAALVLIAVPTAYGQDTGPRNLRIVVVTHGQAADPFWSVVKKGVDQAGADMRVKVEYQAPVKFDMVAMSQLIDAAVASKPNGLIVSMPDVAALSPSVKKAIAAGIPVIVINGGWPDDLKIDGVIAHIGQTETGAGQGAGERMAAGGAKNALCVNQEVGNASLDQRCQGFSDAITKAGGKSKVLAVDLNDPTGSAGKISAALTADSTIDSILTLGPTGAAPALKALTDAKLLGKIQLATFDLSPEVLKAIQDGNITFAIDQQQYTQGYLAVVYMTLYLTNLNTPGDKLIPTGPGFVTKDNASKVIDLSKAGTR